VLQLQHADTEAVAAKVRHHEEKLHRLERAGREPRQ
jgi:hypothetical protein